MLMDCAPGTSLFVGKRSPLNFANDGVDADGLAGYVSLTGFGLAVLATGSSSAELLLYRERKK